MATGIMPNGRLEIKWDLLTAWGQTARGERNIKRRSEAFTIENIRSLHEHGATIVSITALFQSLLLNCCRG